MSNIRILSKLCFIKSKLFFTVILSPKLTSAPKKKKNRINSPPGYKRRKSSEVFIFLTLFILFFVIIGKIMGSINLVNTLMNTAYELLIKTVFYIMAIAVLAGAISGLFSEFGVVALLNKILSPLMKPLYDLPGAAVLGVVAPYLSDNPAVLSLAKDKEFRRCFHKYQLPGLTEIGTSFGMGMIITAFMIGLDHPAGENFIQAALIGNLGAIIGSIVCTRMMLYYSKKTYGVLDMCDPEDNDNKVDKKLFRKIREGNVGSRFLDSMLNGGKTGVEMGIEIVPGVLIICTIVMVLTKGPSTGGDYTGAAFEGVRLLPYLGEKLSFLLDPLFGFSSPADIAVPITAMGAAGAAIGLVPSLVANGLAHANDIAVFTAMSMCWSGYLSTHVAMMDALDCSKLTGKAIFCHTIGGLVAGISAHYLFLLFT